MAILTKGFRYELGRACIMDLGDGWEVVLVDLLVDSFLAQNIHAAFVQVCLQYHLVRP